MDKSSPIILSLGGSLIVPNGGMNTKFLRDFNEFIRKKVAKGWRFFIEVGGGKTARHYRDAGAEVAGKITEEDLDWLGIHATRLNAHLIRTIFQDIAHPRIIENYSQKLKGIKEPIVIAAGWKPGWSTDYDAVLLARDYGASTIINMSNIEMVYDKDPNQFKDARPIERTTWKHFEKLVGTKWTPGINAPFDPVATQLAQKLGLNVIILKGDNLNNLDHVLEGKKFKGTIIMPFKLDASFYDKEYFEGGVGEYGGYTTKLYTKYAIKAHSLYRSLLNKLFLHPRNLLDVGCATGQMVRYLRSIGVDARGVELSDYALSRANPSVQPFLKKGSVTKIPYPDDSFEVVTTFDLLEHIPLEDLPQALFECNRVAQKYVLHKIYTEENWWIRKFHLADISHVSVYNKTWWHNFFQKLGYRESKVFYPRMRTFMETVFILEKT